MRAALDDPEGLRLAPTPELLDTPVPHVDLPSSTGSPEPVRAGRARDGRDRPRSTSTPDARRRAAPTTRSPRRASTTARPPRSGIDDGSTPPSRARPTVADESADAPLRRPPRGPGRRPTPTSVPDGIVGGRHPIDRRRLRRPTPTTPTPGCSDRRRAWSPTSCSTPVRRLSCSRRGRPAARSARRGSRRRHAGLLRARSRRPGGQHRPGPLRSSALSRVGLRRCRPAQRRPGPRSRRAPPTRRPGRGRVDRDLGGQHLGRDPVPVRVERAAAARAATTERDRDPVGDGEALRPCAGR